MNVRLLEGGAAKIALDLHRKLLSTDVASRFAYGWGEKGGKSSMEASVANSFQVGQQLQVASNMLMHRIVGVDYLPPLGEGRRKMVEAIHWADVVHLHVIHSYFLPLNWLVEQLMSASKPVVWTAHDHWMLTGRCAFTDGCQNWKYGCGSCPSGMNYPPSLIDISQTEYVRKRKWIDQLGERLTIVAPSKYLAGEIRNSFPKQQVITITNAIDGEMEKVIRANNIICRETKLHEKVIILVISNGLAYEGKTNRRIVNAVVESGNCIVHTVGNNSPFRGKNIVNHGDITSRRKLVSLYSSADAMLFTSQVDSFGLVMAEALSCGTPVIATHSQASEEVLGMVGGTTYLLEEDIVTCVQKRTWWEKYPYKSAQNLKNAALEAFVGETMSKDYIALYESVH